MSDDEESRVRRRLSRLFDPPAPSTGGPLGGPGPSTAGPPTRPGPPTVAADPPPGSSVGADRHASGSDPAARPRRWPDPVEPGWPTFDLLPPARSYRPTPDPVPRAGPEEPPGPGPSAPAEPSARVVRSGDEEPARRMSRLPGPGAFDPGRRGVRALAVVALVVVLGAGLWAWRSRPHPEPVRPVSTVAAPAVPAASPAGSPSAANGQLVVAVAGKVRRPGLVRVPAGARVADAVEAAGGALPGVDVALLNPARKLTDGELILVGIAAPPGLGGQPPAGGAAGPAVGGAAPGGPINLNTATLAQLDALPGVGPVLAQRILTHREQHGGFRSVADLRQVEGIGDARYEQLKDLVTV